MSRNHKSYYARNFYYDESFEPEMQVFERLIKLDPKLKQYKTKNSKAILSIAFRHLIRMYNQIHTRRLQEGSHGTTNSTNS